MPSWGGPERPKNTGIDWPTVIAFIVVAVLFLAATGGWGQ